MKKKLITLSTLLFLALGINSCSEKEIHTAKVVDSTVGGIEYQCAGLIQYTKADGNIKCYHLPLGFKVGEIKVGILYDIPADGIIFPQDMLGVKRTELTNEDVKKITMLLQTVDEDNNPENGITITKETRKKLDDFIDLQKVSLAELQDYLEAKLNKPVVSQEKAIKHLYRSMREYNALPKSFTLEELNQ